MLLLYLSVTMHAFCRLPKLASWRMLLLYLSVTMHALSGQ